LLFYILSYEIKKLINQSVIMTTSRFKTGVVKKQHIICSLLKQALAQTKIHRMEFGLLPERHHFPDGLFFDFSQIPDMATSRHISSLPRELSQLFA